MKSMLSDRSCASSMMMRVVAAQVAVALHLGEQDAVGHHLQPRRVAAVVGEPHLVPHELSELDLHLLGDPLRHRACGDPARLGVADLCRSPATELEAHLRQLGRLAGARLAGHDDHLVVAQCRQDVVAPLDDREVLGVPQPGRVDHVDGLGRHGAKDRSERCRRPTGYPAASTPRLQAPPRRRTPPGGPTARAADPCFLSRRGFCRAPTPVLVNAPPPGAGGRRPAS